MKSLFLPILSGRTEKKIADLQKGLGYGDMKQVQIRSGPVSFLLKIVKSGPPAESAVLIVFRKRDSHIRQ